MQDNKDVIQRRIVLDSLKDIMKNIAMLPLKDDPELQKKVRKAWQGK